MESTDIVIIGSGVGGLSAAAHLAQAGKKVIVLERDCHIGGTAHLFTRDGFTFPAGPISITMPAYISDTLSRLGVEESLYFIRDCFQVRRGNMDIMISAPMQELTDQLIQFFPEEKQGIVSVINILDEVMDALELMKPEELIIPSSTANSTARLVLERWGSVSACELVNSYLKDERLRELLGSQGSGDPETSVVLLAQMWLFMCREGIWYVKGGVNRIPELLAIKAKALGAIIRLGTCVKRILVQDGTAFGVELEGGNRIYAPTVISDADYKETFSRLLPRDVITVNTREEIESMELTSSSFTIFLGVKKEKVDLSAFKGHRLLVKIKEGQPIPWEQKRWLSDDFMNDDIWISWWSKHDPCYAPHGHEALMINLTAPFDHFAAFSGGGRGRHKTPYYSMKEAIGDAVVKAVSIILPGLNDAVVAREVATPLTYRYWGHRSEGSTAGWSWRFNQQSEPWAKSLAVTPVHGLLMTGLHSFTRLFYGGMGTSLYSGRYVSDIVNAS